MADYYRPSSGNKNVKKGDKVNSLVRDYGGAVGEEGALLNGLLALGYDPELVRTFADADPNRRYLDDAVVRALRAGVLESDIKSALKATRAAAEGRPQDAIRALGKRREDLPPESQKAFDAIANRQPLPFFNRGQAGGAGAPQATAQIPTYSEDPGPGEAKKQGAIQAAQAQKAAGAPPGGSRVVGGGAGGGGGGGGGGGAGGGIPNAVTPPKLPKTEAEVRAYIDENYSQWAYLQDIPEVWNVVKEAAKGGWSDDRVLGGLQKTPWWQKTEASARVWKEQRYQDPATAQDKINKKTVELKKAAVAAGITIPDNELAGMAEDSLRFDWDANEQKAALGRFFRYDKEKLMGTALVTQQQLTAKARDWLVPMDDATLQDWTTKVVTGEMEESYFDGYMKQQASTLFPQLADPISRGIPPGQWMSPYKSIAAQTLGINPDQIDLRESKWMKSINQVGPDGKRTAMNLSDWEDMLKTDETYGWDKTEAGREHGATMARKLAGMFRGNA